MRICYVASLIEIPHRDGLGSGGSTHAHEVARHLQAGNHHVVVVCRRPQAGGPTRTVVRNVQLYRLFSWDSVWYARARVAKPEVAALLRRAAPIFFLWRSLVHLVGLLRFVARDDVDIVYERSSKATNAATLVSVLCRKPLVLEVNDHLFTQLSLQRARRIVTPAAEMIPARFRSKVVALDWGVDTERFHPHVDGEPARRACGLSDERVLLFVGSGLAWHGLEDMIRAATIVHRAEDGVVLVVVGGGTHIDRYRREVDDRGVSSSFRFTGAVPHQDVPSYVAAADVTLAPYNSELAEHGQRRFASPMKVLEYMACAKPVVVTDVGNARGFVEDGRSGLVVPADAPDALADAILRLLRSPDLRARLGASARTEAERHSWAEHCARLEEAFRRARAGAAG